MNDEQIVEWLEDGNGNRCSVSRWGSTERAQQALDSLRNCSSCSNCWNCSSCSNCWSCSDCSRCFSCSECFDCSGCWGCSGYSPMKVEFEIPAIQDIHRVVYLAASQPGALKMNDWHTCEKTHCRAGWVVVLAGDKGRELEKRTNTLFAAHQIYKASGYQISPCRFYDDNDVALADMKRLAESEADDVC